MIAGDTGVRAAVSCAKAGRDVGTQIGKPSGTG
jgi:hypothetical protein